MAEAKVQQIAQEIRMLTEVERQELIAEILPLLLVTQGSVQAVTRALDALSTEELDALVEHARMRNAAIPETTLSTVLRDALHTPTGGTNAVSTSSRQAAPGWQPRGRTSSWSTISVSELSQIEVL
jgi:hypothetical protein